VGNISEKFARDIAFQFLSFLKSMNDKGFVNYFDSKDVFFEKNKGKILFNNYGDSCHFLKKPETGTDIWELGALLFNLLKGIPPYQNRLPNDMHYNCLNKGQF
jgi:serine/threonine protein kinase